MSPTATQRPVPIRPSPAKCLLTNSKAMMCFAVNTNSSPSTLTPPRTGAKRKFEDFDDDDDCSSPESVKCKRKINFASNNNNNNNNNNNSCPMSHPPAAVARRNARERNRVKQVNNGFATLRQHIPGAAKAKKISKVETLKQAVDYIRSLQLLLDENDYTPVNNSSSHAQQQLNSVPVTSYDYTTTTIVPMNNTYAQTKLPQYPTYYYSENVSPVCTSVYSQNVPAHSPACSDGATSSPSPSYISDTNSHLGSVEPAPVTVLPDDINHTLFLTADAFTANFGMQYLERYEEEDFIETCIENWESK